MDTGIEEGDSASAFVWLVGGGPWGLKEATLLGGRDGEEVGIWVEKLHERELGLWLKRTN
jgi:hypothetical protein